MKTRGSMLAAAALACWSVSAPVTAAPESAASAYAAVWALGMMESSCDFDSCSVYYDATVCVTSETSLCGATLWLADVPAGVTCAGSGVGRLRFFSGLGGERFIDVSYTVVANVLEYHALLGAPGSAFVLHGTMNGPCTEGTSISPTGGMLLSV